MTARATVITVTQSISTTAISTAGTGSLVVATPNGMRILADARGDSTIVARWVPRHIDGDRRLGAFTRFGGLRLLLGLRYRVRDSRVRKIK